ncbi:hypothetical protein MCAG_00833 [Micromonospora sp. ATCC 39149]|uniref:Tetratricopeptide repeat protein n=1 Tax=Micromonospora carbonacea TaxID=47853 RepID=A0A7D5YAR7_9ACTN|nr:hypothetical protein MCAG_00833 [Micromonospora sp. ATCC 39149]QLJ96897.1 hypothetical protein HZU44_18615 [Micromonospora carbonacea]
MLLTRFERTGDLDDLELAIKLTEAAVDATAPEHAKRGSYLSNLGSLLTRFEQLASEADLDAAIEAHQAAVTGWPDDPEHAGMRADFDLALRTRARFRDQISELDRVIELARTGSANQHLRVDPRRTPLQRWGRSLIRDRPHRHYRSTP